MSSVFISYRRQTAAGEARALFNDLTARLGENAAFMDVDSISLGRDFRGELQKTLAACDLMLVIIDKDWASAKDERGRVRLENAGDFVRMEIEAALKRDIVVTPILVKGAQMPAAEELPAEIRDLAYRNGFELSHNRWESDVREMIRRLNLDSHEQVGEVETGRSARLEKRPAAEIPPVPKTPQQIGSSKPPVMYAGWLTRRRLLTTGAATVVAGALGGGAYRFRNWKEKEKPITETNAGPIGAMPGGPIAAIAEIAAQSAIASYKWGNQRVAPAGYIKGMALVYARVYCKLKAGDAAALDMAKANTGDVDKDALAHYAEIFAAAGMNNAFFAASTLRHLFVLVIGLGISESGGNYCSGRDILANNVTSSTAEAGLFQTDFNAMSGSPLMMDLFNYYFAHPLGFEDVFSEGARCKAGDFQTFGDQRIDMRQPLSDGARFQQLSKGCPAFAAEFAAVGLRHIHKHWGPIVRRAVEVVPECDEMLRLVQAFVDASPNIHAALL